MQVSRWGNSLAVRLPAIVVEALGLKEGDEIEIHVANARQFGVARKPGRDYRHVPDFGFMYRYRHLMYGPFAVYRRHRGYAK